MSADRLGSVFALVEDVRFAYQPLINVTTGGVMAVEALARPSGMSVHQLFSEAARQRRLPEVDVELAIAAVQATASQEPRLPLHLNLFGGTVAYSLPDLGALREAVHEVGRREHEITLEISPPLSRLPAEKLVSGVEELRDQGFQIALDGVGDGDVPMTLLGDLAPDAFKIDRGVVRGLADDRKRTALLEALRHVAEASGSSLIAEGVESERELHALRRNGVRLVQGDLLSPPAFRAPANLTVPGVATEVTDPRGQVVTTSATGPRVTEFLAPATMLSADATADHVREVLADHPDVSSVVLVDDENRPQWTIDRNRFLVAVTGPYGHALHATRPAARLADEPRLVTTATTAFEALELVTGSDQYRTYDDAIVVDDAEHCLGMVRASDLIRGVAELKVEQAATLNPLTRLPGSDAVERDVARRIADDEVFAVSWLDIDNFKGVNDRAGFSAGDELIRSVGRSLTDAAASLGSLCVGHVGGDDFLLVADLDDLPAVAETVLDPPRRVEDVAATLSLATVVCTPSVVSGYDEVSRSLAPLKKVAKELTGSSWVLSRPDLENPEILRGRRVEAPGIPAQSEEAEATSPAEI
jgi:diguanylate cyclase (GGDEF)-like protein